MWYQNWISQFCPHSFCALYLISENTGWEQMTEIFPFEEFRPRQGTLPERSFKCLNVSNIKYNRSNSNLFCTRFGDLRQQIWIFIFMLSWKSRWKWLIIAHLLFLSPVQIDLMYLDIFQYICECQHQIWLIFPIPIYTLKCFIVVNYFLIGEVQHLGLWNKVWIYASNQACLPTPDFQNFAELVEPNL